MRNTRYADFRSGGVEHEHESRAQSVIGAAL